MQSLQNIYNYNLCPVVSPKPLHGAFIFKQSMKEIKLSSIDKFHLKNLVNSIKYLKNSENAKQWLTSNNYRLLIQLFKIEDEYANFKIEDEILENFQ